MIQTIPDVITAIPPPKLCPVTYVAFEDEYFRASLICEIKLSSSLESDFAVIRMKPP